MPKPPRKPPDPELRGRHARAVQSAGLIEPERLSEARMLFAEFDDRAAQVAFTYQRSLDQLQKIVETVAGSAILNRTERDAVLKQICLHLPPELTPQFHGVAPGPPKQQTSVPDHAPQLWKDGREITLHLPSGEERKQTFNPVQFIRGVYGRWIGRGLTRRHLNRLDPDLYRALSVWEHRHPEDRLTELPTLAEEIDAKIAALAHEFSPDELRKLGSTLQTRHRRSKN
ncbi:MAG: hypothetical protein AB7J30_00280 [Hyphomicrobium sp.]|uniref:hypothetical protein n=1 Tax=Hyphomicrobium sp. TaxID=82 RepID=UPI003D0F0560